MVDTLPRETQGHAVGDAGTFEGFTQDIDGDTFNIIVLRKILAVFGHVVRREVFSQ